MKVYPYQERPGGQDTKENQRNCGVGGVAKLLFTGTPVSPRTENKGHTAHEDAA